MGLPPIAGITLRTAIALIILGGLSIPAWREIGNPDDWRAWVMIIVGGGVVAGSLGMWSFYSSLTVTENLGVTLAIAFSISPLTGTVVGLISGTQRMDPKIALGMAAIIAGIVLVQTSHRQRPP